MLKMEFLFVFSGSFFTTIHRISSRLSSITLSTSANAATIHNVLRDDSHHFENAKGVALTNGIDTCQVIGSRFISVNSGGSDSEDDWDSAVGGSFGESGREIDDLGWDSASSWSTGLTKDHFDGVASVSQRTTSSSTDSGKDDGDGRKIDAS